MATPIPFDAVDDAPVDIIFSLLSPIDSGAEHLKTLARVSRYLRSAPHITRLRGAQTSEAIMASLNGDEARDAA
jgi:PTS system nitrogen regulatory IIA component